jgi:hypothetical protein
MQFLRFLLAEGSKDVRRLPLETVGRLLATVIQAKVPIRTIHYSRGLIRATVWTPDAVDRSQNWEFIQGDEVGLHVNGRAIKEVWLWTGRCSCCDHQHWTLEIGDASDAVGLAITVGCEKLELDWRKLIKSCLL